MNRVWKAITDVGRAVSPYASRHPNEVIAEVFAGLMMGVQFDDRVMQIYQTCGGPMPPDGTTHIRKGRTMLKRTLYTLAKPIRFIGDGL